MKSKEVTRDRHIEMRTHGHHPDMEGEVCDPIANRDRCLTDRTMRIRMHHAGRFMGNEGEKSLLTMVEERARQRGEDHECQEQTDRESSPEAQHRAEVTGFPRVERERDVHVK